MNFSQAVFLGLLQGSTEFLPISSSGHLVIAQHQMGALGPSSGGLTEIIAHLGTLLAVLIVFRAQILRLARYGLWQGWTSTTRDGVRAAWWDSPSGKIVVCIAVATTPTAIIGFAFHEAILQAFGSARIAGAGLLGTSAILLLYQLRRPREDRTGDLGIGIAFAIGLAQSAALMPGVSRSGATIVCAVLLGLRRREAFEFSFLIAIPIILGGAAFECLSLSAIPVAELGWNAVVFVGAFVSGWAALLVVRSFLDRGRFGWFAFYCFPLGIWALFFC